MGVFGKDPNILKRDYREDLESILSKCTVEKGYRDARILSDKLTWNDDNTINLDIELEEGNRQYRFLRYLFLR